MKVCLKKARPSANVLWYHICAFSVEDQLPFKCTFQGLTSQRPKLKHTYHKGVQHMHSSWKLRCDMKDIQTLYVILKMSKAWPFRCPTRGKHPHPAKLQASESWKSDHKASNSHWFQDVCDCENWAHRWIRGGRLPGGCEPLQQPLRLGTRRLRELQSSGTG